MNINESITIKSVQALQVGDTIRDTKLKGFGARRRGKAISYFVHTEIHRRQRWFTIGTHGNPWTPDQARKRAEAILYGAKNGLDITAIPELPATATFAEIFHDYVDAQGPHVKNRTMEEYKRLAQRNLIPHFKNKPFATISRDDVMALHKSLAPTPSLANHALAVCRLLFNWAETENKPCPPKNPCLRIKLYKTRSRAKFLTIDDLTRLAEAFRWALMAEAASPTQVSAILLLLFTGARRGEIFTLRRDYVDRQRMLAHLPDSKTGTKVLHLNAHAMAVLESLPEVDGNPYYLAGRIAGKSISDVKKPWDRIRKKANLEGFRLHDFRHSFASFAADGGASAQAVGAILGHASIETTKIYMHLFNNRAKETTTATADRMHSIISQAPPAPDHAKPTQPLRLSFLRRRPFLPGNKPGIQIREVIKNGSPSSPTIANE